LVAPLNQRVIALSNIFPQFKLFNTKNSTGNFLTIFQEGYKIEDCVRRQLVKRPEEIMDYPEQELPILEENNPDVTDREVDLSEESISLVEADKVHLDQCGVDTITAETVNIQDGGARTVNAQQLYAIDSGLGVVQCNQVKIENGGAIVISAQEANLSGNSLLVISNSATLEDQRSGAILAREVHGKGKIQTVVLLAGQVNSPVETIVDQRSLALFGVLVGLSMGLVLSIFRLFGNKK
jgi:hypothetical protein